MGDKETDLTKKNIGWEHGSFEIPKNIYEAWDGSKKGGELENNWDEQFKNYKNKYPEEAEELLRRVSSNLPKKWLERSQAYIKLCNEKEETIATRKASQNCIEAYADILPEMIGGSADLGASNLTIWSGSKEIKEFKNGNYINYGVREFGMSAIMNGLSSHSGFIPYGGTCLLYTSDAARRYAVCRSRWSPYH